MVARFLIYSACFLLSACLAGSDSNSPTKGITYETTNLGSGRYQVAFKANIDGQHSGYWEFGDGYVSKGRSVNHIYYSPGQYTITYSYDVNGQQQQLTDTLLLEGIAQNLSVISRERIVIDSDHNDPNQSWQSNNSVPQTINVPAKVSGVMLAAKSCQTGRLCEQGDDIDRYSFASDTPIKIEIQSHDGQFTHQISQLGHAITGEAQAELAPGRYDLRLARQSTMVRYTITLRAINQISSSSYQPGKLIVRYRNNHQPELLDISDPKLRAYHNLEHARSMLAQRSDIESVSYNYWRFPSSFHQWSLSEFAIPYLWQLLPNKGMGVRVAVIDTGLYGHKDLSATRITDGYDFISDPLQSDDGDGWDNDPTDAAGSGHGTHVAGIIAAQGTLHSDSMAGISPNVTIMPLRAIGRFGATSYDLIQSMLYAAGLHNDSGELPDRPADIINLSLGGESYSQIERDVIQYASELGVIFIAAAGNQGKDSIEYPAAYKNVLAVGAHDRYGNIPSYSNTGNGLDLIAPGGACSDANCSDGIVSLDENGYNYLSGTSMSTAFVSAVMASVKANKMDMDSTDLRDHIEQGAITQHAKHQLNQGWGQLDMAKLALLADQASTNRIWLPKTVHRKSIQQDISITGIKRGNLDLDSMQVKIMPNTLKYRIEKINQGRFHIHITDLPLDAASVSMEYYNGSNWSHVSTAIKPETISYHVGFLDHLYVQLDRQRTPLRASANDPGWKLQLTQDASRQTIQVSSDIDYDGIYCELGEFCGQKTLCTFSLSRGLDACESGTPNKAPLSGRLIDP